MFQFFDAAFVDRIGWVLVHSVWQLAVLGVLAAFLESSLARCAASVRYWVLLSSLLAMALAPIGTWTRLRTTPASESAAAEFVAAPTLASNPATKTQVPETPSTRPPGQTPAPSARRKPAGKENVAPIGWTVAISNALQPWLAELVFTWFVGVIVFAQRPLLSWLTVRRLRRDGVAPVTDAVEGLLTDAARRLGVRRAVTVFKSTLVNGPLTIGHLRPVILLPAGLMTGLPESQIDAILAHELAHIRRHDFLVNLLQTAIESLFFYHPAVWRISRRIRIERENCCDDLALAAVGSRVQYGRALLAVAELPCGGPMLSLGATDGSLLSRVERIVGAGGGRAAPAVWSTLLITACWIVMGLAGMLALAEAKQRQAKTVVAVEWSAVVDESVLDEIRKLHADAKNPSKDGTEMLMVAADDLRSIIKRHQDDEAKVMFGNRAEVIGPSPEGFRPTGIARTASFVNSIPDGDRFLTFSWGGGGTLFVEEQTKGARVRLNFQGNISSTGSRPGQYKVQFDDVIEQGRAAVVVMTPKAAADDWRPSAILVYEAMTVPTDHLDMFKFLTRPDEWFRFGPNGVKQQVARAAAWQSRATADPYAVDRKWTRQVEGGRVQLVALSRPRIEPMIWWTPDGAPINFDAPRSFTSLWNQEFVALVRVWETNEHRNVHPPGTSRSSHGVLDLPDKCPQTPGSQLVIVPVEMDQADGRPTLKIGVGMGRWMSEVQMPKGRGLQAKLGDLVIRTANIHEWRTMGQTTASFNWAPTPVLEITAVAVTDDGQKVWPVSNPSVFANAPANTRNSAMPFRLPLREAQIDHFLIKSRPRHWTTFEDFAARPMP